MNISHNDEQQQFHQFTFGRITGYGETPGTFQVQLPFLADQQNMIMDAKALRPYFGKDYGVLMEPEVNDFVFLYLYGKHARMAIIMGTLPPEDSAFLKQHTAENTDKILCTKEQIKVLLHDEKDKQKLLLETPKQQLYIDDEAQIMGLGSNDEKNYIRFHQEEGELQLHADQKLTFSCGDSSFILAADGTLTMTGKTLHIKVEKAVIDAEQKMEIKAQEMAMEANVKMEISGKSSFKVTSNAVFEIIANLIKIGS